MSIKNLKLFNKAKWKTRFCLFSLVGVLSTTPLTACQNNKKEEKPEKDTVLLQLGNNTFSLEIEGFQATGNRLSITLKDGTYLYVSKENTIFYSSKSETMKALENDIVKIESLEDKEEISDTDTALLFYNDNFYSFGIEDYKISTTNSSTINLEDGTTVVSDYKNVLFYDDDSKIMDQIEEHVHVKKL